VTPTSYLELINTFKALLQEKRKEIMDLKNRYGNGYSCLIKTEGDVFKMQKELEDLQPILVQKGQETEQQLIVVSKENAEAQIVKDRVAVDEAEAQKFADEAGAIKKDCEEKLAEAIPALNAAKDAVNCIKTSDIAVLKGFSSPPAAVGAVTKVVCMFMDVKPDSKMNPQTQKKEYDWWGPSIKMMQQSGFLNSLINYDKEGIQ